MDDGFTEIGGGETWNGKDSNLAIGANIVGEYVRHQTDVGPNNANMYTLRTDEGDMGIWGSTVLDGRFEQAHIGDIVRVTYMGESDKPGKFGKKFKLWKVESKNNPNPSATVPEIQPDEKTLPVQDAKLDEQGEINLDELDY